MASGGGDIDHKDGHDLVGGEQGTEAATASYGAGKSTGREGEGGGAHWAPVGEGSGLEEGAR